MVQAVVDVESSQSECTEARQTSTQLASWSSSSSFMELVVVMVQVMADGESSQSEGTEMNDGLELEQTIDH